MTNKELYIIGNGFDIHHGIQSNYAMFKDYLRENDRTVYNLIDEYLPVEEKWSDLEECLAHIDIDNIIDYASQFLMSYGAEDWSDAYHHDYQYEIYEIIKGLSSTLLEDFTEWIKQLEIPSRCKILDKVINLPKNGIYLTFNYTNTLQRIYDIPKESILFIHGEAESNDNLILGHAWNPILIPKIGDMLDPESIDTRVMEGNTILNKYFGDTFKDSKKIISEKIDFFKNLEDVSVIYVMGHSMSDVDMEYFNAIIDAVDVSNTRWKVSYYGESGLKDRQSKMRDLGIDESLVEYYELEKMRI